jgi:predicted enzyme related to lactoylglutathione lyase
MARRPSNPVVHLELHTGDLPAACAFYAGVCGWRQERIGGVGNGYLALDLADRFGGGIVECETSRSLWLPYVEVTDVGAATEQARQLGATVLLEPRAGPAGRRSVVTAPAAGEIAFWQPRGG